MYGHLDLWILFACLELLNGMAFLLQLLRSSVGQATGVLVACPHVRILLGSEETCGRAAAICVIVFASRAYSGGPPKASMGMTPQFTSCIGMAFVSHSADFR